jgi:hypothetical protein
MLPSMGSLNAAEMIHGHELIAFYVRELLADEGSTVSAMGEIESHADEEAALGATYVSLESAVAVVA